MILHEIICELHIKKMESFSKLILRKLMIRLIGNFLQLTLRLRGFDHLWCHLVKTFVQGGNIKLNDQIGSYFQTRKRS